MNKRLELHEAAFAELDAAFDWYFLRSPQIAAALLDEIDIAFEMIQRSPGSWPVYFSGTRKFVLRRFPFLVVYREKSDVIEIVAVAHGRRKPFYWTDRL